MPLGIKRDYTVCSIIFATYWPFTVYQVVSGATHSFLLVCTITFQGDAKPDGDLPEEARNGDPDPGDGVQGAALSR